jgi:hypothetical protein
MSAASGGMPIALLEELTATRVDEAHLELSEANEQGEFRPTDALAGEGRRSLRAETR